MKYVERSANECKETVVCLEHKLNKANSEIAQLQTELKSLKSQVTNNEAQSRRYNLKFHGVGENEANSGQIVKKLITETMNIELCDKSIARVHRIGPPPKETRGKPWPIIVKFESYKERTQVWEERTKLKGTNIYLTED